MRVWWVDRQTSFVRCFNTWLVSIFHLIFSPSQNSRPCFGRSRFSARFTTHVLLSSFDWFIGLFASVYSFDYCQSVNSGSDTAKSLSVPFFTVQIYPIKKKRKKRSFLERVKFLNKQKREWYQLRIDKKKIELKNI